MADIVTQLRSLLPWETSARAQAPVGADAPPREQPGSDFLPGLPSFARRIFGLGPVRGSTPALPEPSRLGVTTRRTEIEQPVLRDQRLDAPVQGPPPPPPPPPPPIQRGETSDRVRELQVLLKSLRLLANVSGTYDRATERAVYYFQSNYTGPDGQQLPDTGLPDAMTMRALRDYKRYLDSRGGQPPRVPDELVNVEPNYDGIGTVQVLRRNSTGPEVVRAQKLLRALGYDVEPTGTFDERTHNAVSDFQQLYTMVMGAELEPDGVLGPNTGASMALAARRTRESPMNWLEYARRYREQQRRPQPPVQTAPPLRAGSTDRAAVTDLQNTLRALNYDLAADGSFGALTTAALSDFQQLYTLLTGEVLVADGVLNDATRAALHSARQNRMLERLPEPLRRGMVTTGYNRGVPVALVVRSLGDGAGGRLETRAALAYYAMRADALRTGAEFRAGSSFRTMDDQHRMRRMYPTRRGSRANLGRAATPGFSTHQTGISLDTENVNPAGAEWLRENARRYGYMLPGYGYTDAHGRPGHEHWHWEYRVDRLPNAVRRFYGLPELAQDPVATAAPAAPGRTQRHTHGRTQPHRH